MIAAQTEAKNSTTIENYVNYLLASACLGNGERAKDKFNYSFQARYEKDAADIVRGIELAENLNREDSSVSGTYQVTSYLRGLSADDLNHAKRYYQNRLGSRMHLLREVLRLDTWDILSRAEREIPALLTALRDGNIDGINYFGKCACLVGTLARAKTAPDEPEPAYVEGRTDNQKDHSHPDYREPVEMLCGIVMDVERPAESWVTHIDVGDTPANSVVAWVVQQMVIAYARSRDITMTEL